MGRMIHDTYTNGTSALKMPRFVESPDDAAIIAFPTSRERKAAHAKPAECAREHLLEKASGAVRNTLESSEMYCSLRYESLRGCPYNLFTQKGIAALSAGSAVIGVLSLILGS